MVDVDCDRCALVGPSAGSTYAQGTELGCLQLEKEYVQLTTAYLMGVYSLKQSASLTSGSRVIFYTLLIAFKTVAAVRKLPEIFKFILAWFILSDGINTITAILFVILYRDLAFSHLTSLYVSALLAFTAGVGSHVFMMIRRTWKLSTMTMNMICLALYIVELVYLVGAPYFTTSFGLRNVWEGWFFMGYNGFIISTFFGSCRVMLSELCPPGDESEWFSLYLLADKGSSW